MKLSFSTLGCPDWSFEKILSEAQRIGFTGLEIRGIDGKMRAEEVTQFSEENKAATQKMLADKGLTIVSYGTSCSFHDDANFDAAIEEGKHAIDVCVRMGIPAIRVFGDRIENEAVKAHVTSQVAKGIRILCEYARGKNVKVMQEVHGDFLSIETLMPVVEQVNDCPEFGVLWDIANTKDVCTGNWHGFYNEIKPYLRHVHVKDHKIVNDTIEYCLVGEGVIPVKDIVQTLEADGYTGWYSLEWEKKWHPEIQDPEIAFPAYFEYMKTILK